MNIVCFKGSAKSLKLQMVFDYCDHTDCLRIEYDEEKEHMVWRGGEREAVFLEQIPIKSRSLIKKQKVQFYE